MIRCEQLDDFLDGDLSTAKADSFREHATVCDACRESLEALAVFEGMVRDSKSMFDDWYQDDLNVAISSATLPTADKVDLPIRSRSSASRLLISITIVAATIAVTLLGRKFYDLSRIERRPAVPFAGTQGGQRSESNRLETVSLKLQGSGYLAEPIKSSNPDVTIYWLHPTTDTVNAAEKVDSSATPEQESSLIARRTL